MVNNSNLLTRENHQASNEKMLLCLLNNLPGMAYRSLGSDIWNMEFVSEGCLDLTGFTPTELCGINSATYRNITHSEDRNNIIAHLENCLAIHKPFQLEYRIKTFSGEIKWILERGNGIYDEHGNLLTIEGFAIDISDRKFAEEKLEQTKYELELAWNAADKTNKQLESAIQQAELMTKQANAASAAKSDFLANMSHEIRTPLNSLIGFSTLLLDENLTIKQKDYINIINQSATSLLEIINDILDFSKIEAGRLNLEIIPCDPSQIIENVCSIFSRSAQEKNLELKVMYLTEIPSSIETDPTRLKQCLTNLVGNSLKFTKKGYVHINVSLQKETKSSFLRIEVEDTGIGISHDKQKVIFDPFMQADSSTTREFGGSGLGLSITRNLCKLLNGELKLTSLPGKGSTFILKIPVDTDTTDMKDCNTNADNSLNSAKSQETEQFAGKVLVAEDNPSNQLLIQIYLQRLGINPEIVDDGCDAVSMALKNEYDLIFMDMQMPRVSGFEATSQLRNKKINTPIVALTASAMKEDKEKCLQSGCDDYLAKPINNKELISVLGKYLTQTHHIDSEVGNTVSFEQTEPITSSLADDPELYIVAEMFLSRLPQLKTQLNSTYEKKDVKQLQFIIHDIKGASANSGFDIPSYHARYAEVAIIENSNEKIDSYIDQINSLIDRILAGNKPKD